TVEPRHDTLLDEMARDGDDRNRGGRGLEIEREVSGDGNNQIRIAARDVAGQFGIALSPPFARIPLNQEILPLDISQATEFFENYASHYGAAAPVREIGRWGGSMSVGDAVNLFALLRMNGAQSGDHK